ncbi:MAG: sel1 repeat family protein [Myxococcota bacterium]|nr:sel1 repeat family protein [Myxococcota bacterium]
MDESSTPEALYAEGMRALPRWNDDAPDTGERKARAIALITRAAEAGHLEAIERLAGPLDRERGLEWAIALGRAGDTGSLVSALTNGSWPASRKREVLEEARRGAPWAQVAVGCVYRLGSVDQSTGQRIASTENGYGWIAAAADPMAEGLAWLERAAEAGWAPALLQLAQEDCVDQPARGAARAAEALRAGGTLTPKQRKNAVRLIAELLERAEASIEEQLSPREQLVRAGDADSMAWLGDRYRLGEGVPRDVERARALYEQGVAGRSVDACRELGRMHEEGNGVPVDDERARQLYERAAEMGADAFARDRLAEKYGLAWYARGADEGGASPNEKAKTKAKTKPSSKAKK